MGNKAEIVRKIPKFVLANLSGTAVDLTVLWIMSHFIFHSYSGDYLLSPLISFEAAVFSNYCFSFFFIWKDRTRGKGPAGFFRKYIVYNLSASLVFLVKMGFLLLFEFLFGWNVVACNLAAVCISGIINFSMGEWVIFKRRIG